MLASDSHAKRLLRGMLGAGMAYFVIGLSPLLLLPLMINKWGLDTYGQWLSAQAIASFSTFVGSALILTVQSEVSLLYGKGDVDGVNEVVSTMLACIISVSICSAVSIYALFHLFISTNSATVALIVPIWMTYLLVGQASTFLLKVLGGCGFYGQADSFDAVMRLSEFLIMFSAIYYFGFYPYQAIAIMLAVSIIGFTAVFMFFRAHAPWARVLLRPNVVIIRRLVPRIFSMLIFTMAYNQLMLQGVRVVIGFSYSMTEAGAYNVMNTVARMIRIPVEIGVTVFRVEFGLMNGARQKQRLQEMFIVSNQFAIAITSCGVAFMLIFGSTLVSLFSKRTVDLDIHVFLPLLSGLALEGISFPFLTYLLATGHVRPAALTLLFSLCISYAAVFFFPGYFGLPGVAIAVAGCTALYAGSLIFTTFVSIGMSTKELLSGILDPSMLVRALRLKSQT
jgi:O-antigen/teichoic acid export membrane protein